MNGTDLKKAMIQSVDGAKFITLTELTNFLGYSQQSKKEVKKRYLSGLTCIDKRYFIPEVVENVMKRQQEAV